MDLVRGGEKFDWYKEGVVVKVRCDRLRKFTKAVSRKIRICKRGVRRRWTRKMCTKIVTKEEIKKWDWQFRKTKILEDKKVVHVKIGTRQMNKRFCQKYVEIHGLKVGMNRKATRT